MVQRPEQQYQSQVAALETFSRIGWVNAPAFARLMDWRRHRRAYVWCLRAERKGWLTRHDIRGARYAVVYRISEKGLERLNWLRGIM